MPLPPFFFDIMFTCLDTVSNPPATRRRSCCGTARTPGTCGTWRSSSMPGGVRDAHPRRGTWNAGWIRFRWSRAVPGGAKSFRVTRDRTGRWHVASASIPHPVDGPGTGEVVGIDRSAANCPSTRHRCPVGSHDTVTPVQPAAAGPRCRYSLWCGALHARYSGAYAGALDPDRQTLLKGMN